jgi:hypothetical protein
MPILRRRNEAVFISAFNAENFMKIDLENCLKNVWFYMKCTRKYFSVGMPRYN